MVPRRSAAERGTATIRHSLAWIGRTLGVALPIAITALATAGAQTFQDISAGLPPLHHGTSAWGDYDGDGQLDLLITGENGGVTFADIFRNTSGSFTAINAGLTPLGGGNSVSRSAWGDYDNDGDLDVIVIGVLRPDLESRTKLYRNDGGTFVHVPLPGMIQVSDGTAAWGDYDNDGDLDLFLCGFDSHPTNFPPIVSRARLYRNDGPFGVGSWIFTDISIGANVATIVSSAACDAAWGDYDKDGDLDLAVAGESSYSGEDNMTYIYRNDGGVMVKSSMLLSSHRSASLAWGDYTGDGYLDLAVGGITYTPGAQSFEIYRNNQNGTFTYATSLPDISNGSMAWGDCNNDGRLDILATGMGYTYFSSIFQGVPGINPFAHDPDANLPDFDDFTSYSHTSWGDYDNDGRLDIALTGKRSGGTDATNVHRNVMSIPANTPPTAPAGLSLASSSRSITASWNASTDAQSPSATLTYNLYIKDETDNRIIMSPMANLGTGKRYIPAMGNTNHRRKWSIGGLTPGHTYTVCVQAIDQAFAGSAFSCSLPVTLPANDPEAMIGDCIADIGTEPNNDCISYWNSPNIYTRHALDGNLPGNDTPQQPIVGQTNYVYVKLKNISTSTVTIGTVHVYYTKASTGANWPTHWSGFYSNGAIKGDFIGQAEVINLIGGETRYVAVPWIPPPGINSSNDHFCLLARFTSPADPMTYIEHDFTYGNTHDNNNIAWRNLTRLDYMNYISTLDVGDVMHNGSNMDIQGEMIGDATGTLLDHATVHIQLPASVMKRWQENGAQSEGVNVIDDPRGTRNKIIRLVSPKAKILGIPISVGEHFDITVTVIYPRKWDESIAGKHFFFDVTQYQGTSGIPQGGEAYEVVMPEREPKKTVIGEQPDISGLLRLSAQPNPTRSMTVISYTLPEESRVTIALYDAAGHRIRTLLSPAEQSAGTHAIEWDGTGSAGEAVPSGTYFYRLETSAGAAQGQITIAR